MNKKERIGIITFERYLGKKDIGSSKIRGQWVVNHWPEAELFVQGQDYDVVIYQKAYWVEHAKVFKGIKIFDLCDPDFLHWGYRTKEMIEEVDAITTSTEALAEVVRTFTDKPVLCIPDRIDTDGITKRKYHKGEAKWVAWYGYSTGFDMLRTAIIPLKKLKLNLIVISNSGFSLSIGMKGIELRNLPHSWKTLYDDLLDADIIINPQSKKGKWKYKSKNKTLLAWALGIPVANDINELKRFMNEEERRKEQVLRLKEIDEKWKVEYSVEQYKQLIDSLR